MFYTGFMFTIPRSKAEALNTDFFKLQTEGEAAKL